MLFRVWFYLVKAGLFVLPLAVVRPVGLYFNLPGVVAAVDYLTYGFIVPLAIMGGCLGFLTFVLGYRWSCPACGTKGEAWMRRDFDFGVDCDAGCRVHGNLLTDFRLRVEKVEP